MAIAADLRIPRIQAYKVVPSGGRRSRSSAASIKGWSEPPSTGICELKPDRSLHKPVNTTRIVRLYRTGTSATSTAGFKRSATTVHLLLLLVGIPVEEGPHGNQWVFTEEGQG